VWLLAAACGGGTPAPPPSPANELATLSLEEHARHVQELAVRGCACPDRLCIAEIDRDLAEVVLALPLGKGDVDPDAIRKESEGIIADLERLSVCMTDRQMSVPAFGAAMVDRTKGLRDGVCACTDQGCATQVIAGLLPELMAVEFFPIEAAALEEIRDMSREVRACVTRLGPGLALEELGALRDRACACSEAACADEVQAGFDGFREKHKATKGSDEDARAIGELAAEMSGCLERARGAQP
jgi:hypothetical protein